MNTNQGVFMEANKVKESLKQQVECTIPVLPVKDLQRSIQFYTETLGFELDWKGGAFGSVSRDGKALMLWQALDGTSSTCAWIGLKTDALFDEFRVKGVKVLQEPSNQPWAYEMKFEDIDGNVLWLGTDPR
jgi:catechol 2,3-dioxygenase-like lactoylglutathione lyase family enzyme